MKKKADKIRFKLKSFSLSGLRKRNIDRHPDNIIVEISFDLRGLINIQ